MSLRVIQFLAVVLTALAVIPAGAHLFELPNKIDMPRDAYLTVQGIYAGWASFGIVDLAALVLNFVLAIKLRRQRPAVYFAWTAALCFVVFFAIFFTWTLPANQATANWTTMPDNWSGLRREWESSHALKAVLKLVALCSSRHIEIAEPAPQKAQAGILDRRALIPGHVRTWTFLLLPKLPSS